MNGTFFTLNRFNEAQAYGEGDAACFNEEPGDYSSRLELPYWQLFDRERRSNSKRKTD